MVFLHDINHKIFSPSMMIVLIMVNLHILFYKLISVCYSSRDKLGKKFMSIREGTNNNMPLATAIFLFGMPCIIQSFPGFIEILKLRSEDPF